MAHSSAQCSRDEREKESQAKPQKPVWKPPCCEDFGGAFPNKKIKLDGDSLPGKFQDIPHEPNEPKTVKDLTIHPKKIEEMRNWIRCNLKEKAPILLVTGPAGSGKTTTVRVSAKSEGVLIREWINPVDKTEYKSEPFLHGEVYDKFSFSETNQTDKFEDFVFRSSRYKSLFDTEERVLILVEDIPNIFVWRPTAFHSFLGKYKTCGKSPIIFILTDDQNLNLTSNLFPSHIKTEYNITNIKFNPVNHGLLVKNLKALSDKHCPGKVSSQVLEDIIKRSGGDLRSATNDMLLFLRTSMQNLSIMPAKKGKKGKKTDEVVISGEALSNKDSTPDFYQNIGRILHPKLEAKKERPDNENPHRMFVHDVQEIAKGWKSSFLPVLHENYLQTYTKMDDIVKGAECLSLCDVLDKTQIVEEYKSLIGVTGLMLGNTQPKRTGFIPLRKSFQVEPTTASHIEEVREAYAHHLTRRDYVLDVKPFLKILNKNDRTKASSWWSRPRVCDENDEEEEEETEASEVAEIEDFDD